MALGSRVKQTLSVYRFLFSQKVSLFKIRFNSLKHAFLPETDEVWVEFPEKYPNPNKKRIREISIFSKNETSLHYARNIFGFDRKKEMPVCSDIILYLTIGL